MADAPVADEEAAAYGVASFGERSILAPAVGDKPAGGDRGFT